jgi:hypothetical protein
MSGAFAHMGGMNHMAAMNHIGAMNHMGPMNRLSGLNRMGNTRGVGTTARDGAFKHHNTMARDAAMKRPAAHATTAKSDQVVAQKTHNDTGSSIRKSHNIDDGGSVRGPRVFVPGVPWLDQPVFTDDLPKVPTRPVFADGGNTTTGGTTATPGPNADTPTDIVKVDRPCNGAILKVSTARSECIGGVVHITGDQYYYCPSKNQFQVRHYDYTPIPETKCDGTVSGPQYPLPPGWATIDDAPTGACHRKNPPEYVSQWVAGPQYWELQTWEVYECRDGDKTVDRLFRTPDVTNGGRTPSSEPAPVTPGSLGGK